MENKIVALADSDPGIVGVSCGYPPADDQIVLSLILARRAASPDEFAAMDENLHKLPHERNYLTHAAVRNILGADAAVVAQLEGWFESLGLRFKLKHAGGRHAILAGKIKDVERALGIVIEYFEVAGGTRLLSHRGPILLPIAYHPHIKHISGLAPRPRKEKRIHHRANPDDVAAGPPGGLSLRQVVDAYNFPGAPAGIATTIGVIELGGAYDSQDLNVFCKDNGVQLPNVFVEGKPTGNDSMINDVEVTIDIEIAAAAMVGNSQSKTANKIVVYYGRSIMEAMQLAVNDEQHSPSIISISWASQETTYAAAELDELHTLFYEAAMLGITVLAASGDTGAYDGQQYPNVTLPAAHPLVLGVGGTQLSVDAGDDIAAEVVWNENGGANASGGGFSVMYPLPQYQENVVLAYPYRQGLSRGVPDVAGNAAAASGYRVVFQGQTTPVGGTSAATPLWAGLIAQLNAQLGYRLGFLHTALYALRGTSAFNPILSGNNQLYPAYPGWSAATGLGSADGQQLLVQLRALEPQAE